MIVFSWLKLKNSLRGRGSTPNLTEEEFMLAWLENVCISATVPIWSQCVSDGLKTETRNIQTETTTLEIEAESTTLETETETIKSWSETEIGIDTLTSQVSGACTWYTEFLWYHPAPNRTCSIVIPETGIRNYYHNLVSVSGTSFLSVYHGHNVDGVIRLFCNVIFH